GLARTAHAAGPDPDVLRDAAARPRALGRRARPLARDRGPGGAPPHASGREPAALLPIGAPGHAAVAGAGPARPAGARSRRSLRPARGGARRHGAGGGGAGIGLSGVGGVGALPRGRAWGEGGRGGTGACFVLELALAGQLEAAPGGARIRADFGATA